MIQSAWRRKPRSSPLAVQVYGAYVAHGAMTVGECAHRLGTHPFRVRRVVRAPQYKAVGIRGGGRQRAIIWEIAT